MFATFFTTLLQCCKNVAMMSKKIQCCECCEKWCECCNVVKLSNPDMRDFPSFFPCFVVSSQTFLETTLPAQPTSLTTPHHFPPLIQALSPVGFEFAAPIWALQLDCMQVMLSEIVDSPSFFNHLLPLLHSHLCPHSPFHPCSPHSSCSPCFPHCPCFRMIAVTITNFLCSRLFVSIVTAAAVRLIFISSATVVTPCAGCGRGPDDQHRSRNVQKTQQEHKKRGPKSASNVGR